MKSVHLYAWSRLRSKKLASLSVGLVLFVAVVMSAVSLSTLADLDRPFEAMFERQQGAQLLLRLDSRQYRLRETEDWFRGRPEVLATRLVPVSDWLTGETRLLHRNAAKTGTAEIAIPLALFLAERDADSAMELLEVLEALDRTPAGYQTAPQGTARSESGDGRPELRSGEVWVPNSLAKRFAMRPGDILKLGTANGYVDFIISGIIIDPNYSGLSITNVYRLWVTPGELVRHFPVAGLHSADLHVRLSDNHQAEKLFGDFQDSQAHGYSSAVMTFDRAYQSYSFMFKIIAAALLALSAMMLLIALFVIYSSINSAVLSDYKNIGILKSLGFTPAGVVAVYTWQFSLLTIIAVPPALLVSFFLSRVMSNLFMNAVSVGNPAGRYSLGALCLFLAILAVTTVCGAIFARSAGRIKAAAALRLGESPIAADRRRYTIRNGNRLAVELLFALKQLVSDRKRVLFTGITAALGSIIMIFMISFVDFMYGTADDLGFWGFSNAHVGIALPLQTEYSGEDYRLMLESDPMVAKVALQAYALTGFPKTAASASDTVFTEIFDGDFDDLGFELLEGRNPVGPGEVSLSALLADLHGKRSGDTIELLVASQPTLYKVSGIFQCTNQMGRLCRMRLEAYTRVDPSLEPYRALVWLRDSSKVPAYLEGLRERFGSAMPAEEDARKSREAVLSYIGSSGLILGFSLALLGAAIAGIISANTANELEAGRRNFGIYKAIGFTPSQLRLGLAIKNSLVTLLAALCGALLIHLVQAKLIQLSLGALGIVRIDLPFKPGWTALVLCGLSLFSGAATWLASAGMRGISARTLIVE